jgi:hypothetical protein
MAFTRNQAKQQGAKQQENYLPANSNIYTLLSPVPCNNIDFIDASIEWRKNKIKRDNCTFEYI